MKERRIIEREACATFSPFLAVRIHCNPTPATSEQKEKRAAAITRVAKASKARAQAQLPPTPSHETGSSGSSLVSAVRSIARRLSSNTMSGVVSSGLSECQPSPSRAYHTSNSSCNSSILSGNSAKMSSLVSDSGSTSSSDSLLELEDGSESNYLPLARFKLKNVPAHAFRQGRKASDSSSIHTVRACQTNADLSVSSVVSASSIRLVSLNSNSFIEEENSSPLVTSGLMQDYDDLDSTSEISLGDVMAPTARFKESDQHGTSHGNFLTRIWGAATKAQDKSMNISNSNGSNREKEHWREPAIKVASPKENNSHASAFQRLVQSRSSMFRQGDGDLQL